MHKITRQAWLLCSKEQPLRHSYNKITVVLIYLGRTNKNIHDMALFLIISLPLGGDPDRADPALDVDLGVPGGPRGELVPVGVVQLDRVVRLVFVVLLDESDLLSLGVVDLAAGVPPRVPHLSDVLLVLLLDGGVQVEGREPRLLDHHRVYPVRLDHPYHESGGHEQHGADIREGLRDLDARELARDLVQGRVHAGLLDEQRDRLEVRVLSLLAQYLQALHQPLLVLVSHHDLDQDLDLLGAQVRIVGYLDELGPVEVDVLDPDRLRRDRIDVLPGQDDGHEALDEVVGHVV
jgi:hypothetical protein